jgi:hypothetical protein
MAACAACPAPCPAAAANSTGELLQLPSSKAKLRLVFAHPDPQIQGWPYQGYNYEQRKTDYLSKLRKACPNIEFLPVWVRTAADAEQVLKGDSEVDGYVAYLLGIPSNIRPIAFSGRPTLLIDDLYGGTGLFLGTFGEARRKDMPVAGVSSSNFDDVVQSVNAFGALKKLAASTLLDVTDRDLAQKKALFKQTLGVNVEAFSSEELNTFYERSNRSEAKKFAGAWIAGAETILEPSVDEIHKSAAMYVGMRDLMARRSAQAIAIDCLEMFYGGRMVAYPCLGFFQLNNDGYVGACEADIQSAATMLFMTYLTGRPGYISDPVIDTSKNQIIYAHCVAPNKVLGPQGPSNRYEIRSHSEDRKGAAVRSLLPQGEVTTLKLIPEQKVVVMHKAKAIDNIDEDRACRTKLAAEVRDARRLMADWRYGWHRVTVYGDYRNQVEAASGLLGFKVVEEG